MHRNQSVRALAARFIAQNESAKNMYTVKINHWQCFDFFIVGFQLVWNFQWKRGKFQVKRIRCRPIEYSKCQCNKNSLDQFHSLPTNALNCENRTAYTFFFIKKMFCFFFGIDFFIQWPSTPHSSTLYNAPV